MRVIIGLAFLGLVVALAFWRGGKPEKLFAAVLLAMLVLDRIGHGLLHHDRPAAIEALHLTIDLTSFVSMMAVMIYARRFWPIWACSFQLLSVSTYPLLVLDARLPTVVQTMLAVAPNYLINATLLVGIVCHQVRLRRFGSDPSWRTSSPRATTRTPRRTLRRF
ncbi:MAG: hypothetical protein ABW203_05105 [Novosphingobium sp.]